MTTNWPVYVREAYEAQQEFDHNNPVQLEIGGIMESYEVVWRIEVDAESVEEAAELVDRNHLKECENGSWVYEVSESANLDNPIFVAVEDGIGRTGNDR